MAPLLEGFFGIECGSDLILKSKRKKGKKVGKKKGFGKITNMSIQKYVVVYEYEARYDTELDLYKDEVIMLLGSEDGGWSEGKNDKGKQGWFPTTFVAPFSSNPNSLSNPSIASSSPTPITRHDSRSSVSVLKGTKDDTLADKKKKRSLFTKSMKLTSEDLKRKPEMRKESSVSSSLSSSSHSSPPTPPQKNTFTPPPISPSHSPSSTPVIAPSSPSPLSNSGALHSFSSSPLASSGDHTNETESIVDNMKKTSGYLSKWLNNRVTKEKMKEKGLIEEVEVKQETIFGAPLDNILVEHGAPIPSFVLQAVNYITKNAIKEQGIFRVSGVASVVCSLGQSFAKPGAQVSFDELDCHVVSGFLKKFFRDLPEPLFTFENNDAFLSAVAIENQQERANKFRSIFNSLPKKNQELIVFLLKFLHQVSANSETNLMHSNNLGVVFGPTLMRSKQDTLSSFMNPSNNSVSVIAACISDFELIFGQGDAQPEQRLEQRSERPASHSPVPPQKPRPVPSIPQQAQLAQQAQLFQQAQPVQQAPVQAAQQGAPTPPTKPRSDAKASPPAAKPIFKPPQRPLSTSKPPVPERKEEPKAELARALYDYNGDPAMSQLSFKAGDAIQIVLKHPSGWWTGIVNGRQGLFPMNFIQAQ